MSARDPECLAEAARAGAEEARVGGAAARSHRVEPRRRLERAEQHCARLPLAVADEIHAPVDPVRAVDVDVAGRAEHRRVARGRPTIGVARGIVRVVRLDLDDRSADAVDEEHAADELAGATSCTLRAKNSLVSLNPARTETARSAGPDVASSSRRARRAELVEVDAGLGLDRPPQERGHLVGIGDHALGQGDRLIDELRADRCLAGPCRAGSSAPCATRRSAPAMPSTQTSVRAPAAAPLRR